MKNHFKSDVVLFYSAVDWLYMYLFQSL